MRLEDHRRDTLLREMGIQTYVPRRALPGARACPTTMPIRTAAARTSTTREEALLQVLPPTLRSPAPVVTTEVPPAAPSHLPVADPAVAPNLSSAAARFAFAYIPVNDQLAVINELPRGRAVTLSAGCRQLLAGLLKAIGAPCEPADFSPMVFTWALSDAGAMPVDSESARHTLKGFWSRRLKLRPVRYLLALAEQSAGFLFPAQASWQDHADGLTQHPRLPVELLITHSINAMETERELKRSAWQTLQPLKKALDQARLAGGGGQG